MLSRWVAAALFTPSFYGFATWSVTLTLYSMRLIDWHPSTTAGMTIFMAVMAAFAGSALVFNRLYASAIDGLSRAAAQVTPANWRPGSPWYVSDNTLWLLHGAGFVGLALYVRQILNELNGWGPLLSALLNESYRIRQAEIELLGIYIAYLGWIAIPLTFLRWRLKGRPSGALLSALVLQCAGNLLFIDRTRPIWLVFISVLIVFPFVAGLRPGLLVKRALGLAFFGVTAFYLIGMWVGKIGEGFSHYGFVGVSQEFSVLYYYLTSGYAYFETLLGLETFVDDIPQRSLYPLFKAGAMLGFLHDPVNQILPFIEAPFPTNVGTFLEPYYADGGYLYMAIGVIACTFGVDLLALFLLRSLNPFALFCWANLCFVSFIAFFVPKLVSTPIWLFFFIAALSLLLRATRAPPGLTQPGLPPLVISRHLAAATMGPPEPVPGFELAIPFVDRTVEPDLSWSQPVPASKAPHLRAFFLTRYDAAGPSSRVRTYQFFPALEALGIESRAAPLLTGDYLARRFQGRIAVGAVARGYARRVADLFEAREYDVVWLEKELFPWLPTPAEWLGRIAGRPLVVDYDDAIHERYRGMLAGKIDAIMRRADIVTVGNEYLAEHARAAGAREVVVLPSVVDLARYPVTERAHDDPFTIGWIGTPITARYLEAVRPALERAVSGLGATVRLIGAGEDALAGMQGVERLAWSEATEAQSLAGIDIGIMPLEDGPWERGKCGYKLVQYMAAGRPVIASPVGVNAKLVEHGKDGYLATTVEEWHTALAALALSRQMRASMGQDARAKVEREYSVEVVAPQLAALLRSLA